MEASPYQIFFVGKTGVSLNLGNTAYTTFFGESQNTVV